MVQAHDCWKPGDPKGAPLFSDINGCLVPFHYQPNVGPPFGKGAFVRRLLPTGMIRSAGLTASHA